MKDHSFHLTFDDGASNTKAKPGKNNKKELKVHEGKIHKEKTCFFYKKAEHFKKDGSKRKKWFENKGT